MAKYILLLFIFSNAFADENTPQKSNNPDVPEQVKLFVSNYWKAIEKDKSELIAKDKQFGEQVRRDSYLFEQLKNKNYSVQFTYFSKWRSKNKNERNYLLSFDLVDKNKKKLIDNQGCYLIKLEKNNYSFQKFIPHCFN